MLQPASDEDANIMFFRSEGDNIAVLLTKTRYHLGVEVVEYDGNLRKVLGTVLLTPEKAKRIGDWISHKFKSDAAF